MKKNKRNRKKDNQKRKVLQKKEETPIIKQSQSGTSESAFLKWLKPILQIIAIFVSLIAAFFAYKTYTDNQPAKICLAIRNLDQYTKVDTISYFISLVDPLAILLPLDGISSPIPSIVNKSNKSINNIRIKIQAQFDGYIFDDSNIDDSFILTKLDSASNLTQANFIYKYDVLYAKSSVSTPLNFIRIKDNIDYSDEFRSIYFDYQITYDGITNPIHYKVKLMTVYNEEASDFLGSKDEIFGRFLEELLLNGYLIEENGFSHIYVTRCFKDGLVKINPIKLNGKPLNSDNIEQFTSDIIKEAEEERLKTWRGSVLDE